MLITLTTATIIVSFHPFLNSNKVITLTAVHQIHQIENVNSYSLINEALYISSKNTEYSYDLKKRELSIIKKYSSDGIILGQKDNELQICTYSNYIVKNDFEYATEIKIINNESVKEYQFHEMVKPIHCNNKVILTDNYPGSPERLYQLEEQGLKQLTSLEKNTTDIIITEANKRTLLTQNDKHYLINHSNIYQMGTVHNEWIILKDFSGYLWVAEIK